MRSRHKEDRENRFDPFSSDINDSFGSLALNGSIAGHRILDHEKPMTRPSVERSISNTPSFIKTGAGITEYVGVVGDGARNILIDGPARPTRPRLGDRENTLSLEGRVKRKY